MNALELLLVFSTSLMGSIHCAAMCGGFSLSLVRPGRSPSSVTRVVVYHIGKLFTYVFIGAVAGVAGEALFSHPAVRGAQLALALLAGVLAVGIGLQTFGLLPGRNMVNQVASRMWLGPFLGPFFKTFRQRNSLDSAFFLGLFNGFLPCGLVYTFALTAASTASVWNAMLVMTAFGLGTVPMLFTVAWGGARLAEQKSLRLILSRASGLLVIALGLLTALRGTAVLAALGLGAHWGH